ncbi:MAG: cyclophilin-like fold protein [Anaerolineae bacterium]|jgi:hypothetical protein
MRKIRIAAGDLVETAVLNNSPTADAIWAAVPFVGQANRWGDEIYFEIPVQIAQAGDAREVVEPGELGYWPVGHAFCIFWGPTPASKGDEPRAYSPVNVFGRLEGDPQVFARIASNTSIQVERL